MTFSREITGPEHECSNTPTEWCPVHLRVGRCADIVPCIGGKQTAATDIQHVTLSFLNTDQKLTSRCVP